MHVLFAEELSIDSVLGLLATINKARTRGVSIGAYGDFENQGAIFFISAPIDLQFCTHLDGDNTQKILNFLP